ncbi:MAG: GNAT family N-acetyltransferase [Bacteroidota bacterium]
MFQSNTYTIRTAQAKDARRISYLIQKNTEQVKDNGYQTAQVRVWKKANTPTAILKKLDHCQIFCAFHHRRLVGTIGLKGTEVFGCYVNAHQRGKGIGQLLVHHLIQMARNQGLKQLYLYATPSAKGFYLRHNFKPEEKVCNQIDGVNFWETKMSLYL